MIVDIYKPYIFKIVVDKSSLLNFYPKLSIMIMYWITIPIEFRPKNYLIVIFTFTILAEV